MVALPKLNTHFMEVDMTEKKKFVLRVGLQRKLSTKELIFLNCGTGEVS